MPRFIIESGPTKGREYSFKEGEEIVIGRSKSNRVPIADLMASRHHAKLSHVEGRWIIEDLGSRNGIAINGKRAKKGVLNFKDKVVVGNTEIRFADSAKGKLVGTEIAGYKLLEKIGEGGMGEVYRAHQKSLDRVVALKILPKRFADNEKLIEDFFKEARRAGTLNHPNVIHVHDVGKTPEGLVFFSMEFVDGPTLKEWLQNYRQQDLEPPQAKLCRIFASAADALHYAHTSNLVHRDVKPDNLMLTRDGEVKLADLGIAGQVGEQGSPDGDTPGKRKVLGTPHYMAPEQILGRPADGRLDIYSLGATAYHVFTGHTVFRGKTAQEIVKAHIRVSPTAAGDLNENIPEDLEEVIMRMLAKKPSERFQQATEVAEAFRQVADRLESGSRLSSFLGRFKKSPGE